MYYFKVPIFTKLSRVQNIIILLFQLILLIISILVSLYRGCLYESTSFINGCTYFNVLPGITMITNRTYSSWQFMKPIKYSSELLNNLYTIKYYNILNTTLDNYLLFKGNIVLFDQNNTSYDAVFKDSLNQLSYYNDFNYYFNKNVDMNKETYKLEINDGLLELKFLNNCSNNSVLIEKDNTCFFKNNTYDNINNFFKYYFNEEFIVHYTCHNCYKSGINTLDEAITVLSKCISIFFMLNSFLIMIYIFIISKIKDSDIGYINNIKYIYDINNYKDFENDDINEIIKIK